MDATVIVLCSNHIMHSNMCTSKTYVEYTGNETGARPLAHSQMRVGDVPGEYPSVCTGPYYRVPPPPQKKKERKKERKKSTMHIIMQLVLSNINF